MEFKNLALAIQQHLLRSGRTELPGIGVLQLHYHPARLRRQEGRITPPAEIPEFEPFTEEVIADLDEQLLKDYQQVSGIQQEDLARKDLLKQFRLVEEALGSGQSVWLPEVGTFQSGKNGLLTFEPGAFNYYLEVYGLGPVSARPVLRRTPEEAARIAQEERGRVIIQPRVKTTRSLKDRLFLPGLATLLILSIAGCLWLIFSPGEEPELAAVKSSILSEGEGLNEDYSVDSPGDVTEEVLEDPEVEFPVSDTSAANEQEDVIPPLPEESGVRIAVGHFGNPENVSSILDRLKAAGFSPDSEPSKGSLTRVFITVNPDIQNPRDVLAIIKRDFEPTAWILND